MNQARPFPAVNGGNRSASVVCPPAYLEPSHTILHGRAERSVTAAVVAPLTSHSWRSPTMVCLGSHPYPLRAAGRKA